MKKLLPILVILFTTALCRAEQPVYALAHIIQIGKGGALVELGDIPKDVDNIVAAANADEKHRGFNIVITQKDYWKTWGTVWLWGNFAGKADDDWARTNVVAAGTYQYTDGMGEMHTVHAYTAVQ